MHTQTQKAAAAIGTIANKSVGSSFFRFSRNLFRYSPKVATSSFVCKAKLQTLSVAMMLSNIPTQWKQSEKHRRKRNNRNTRAQKVQHHRDCNECSGRSCTGNVKENCMQDHINKRIPTLLTIMLTEAQNAIENSWVKRKKAHGIRSRTTENNQNYKTTPREKKTNEFRRCLRLCLCIDMFTSHTGFAFIHAHSANDIFGIFAE